MEHEKYLAQVLTGRTVDCSFAFNWETLNVSVALPNWNHCPKKVWGDWGPNYELDLRDQAPVQLRACSSDSEYVHQEELALDRVLILSPFLAQERRRTPLMMQIPWPRKQIVFHLYFDEDAQASKIVVRRQSDNFILKEQLITTSSAHATRRNGTVVSDILIS